MEGAPDKGDIRDDVIKELGRLLPPERMFRIVEILGIEGTDEQLDFIGDLTSAFFTRGIEFGAIEVAAQQIEAGGPDATIEIVHVELP